MAEALWVPQKKRDRRENKFVYRHEVQSTCYSSLMTASIERGCPEHRASDRCRCTNWLDRCADWPDHAASFVDFFCLCTESGCARALMELCNRAVWRSLRHFGGMTPVGNKRRAADSSTSSRRSWWPLAQNCVPVASCRNLATMDAVAMHASQCAGETTWTKSSLTTEVMQGPWRAYSGCSQLVDRHSQGRFRPAASWPG